MSSMRAASWLLALGVALGMTAGCGASVDEDEYQSAIADATGVDALAYTALSESGFGYDDSAYDEAAAECARAIGFDYEAPPAVPSANDIATRGLTPGSEEYVSYLGLGVSTLAFHEVALPDDLVGIPFELRDGTQLQAEAARQSTADMSPADQAALLAALWDPGGCYEQAYETVTGGLTTFLATYGSEIAQLEAQARQDPRIIERNDKLRDCVVAAGFSDFTSLEAALGDLQTQTFAIDGEHMGSVEAIRADEPLAAELVDQLRELQSYEVSLAKAIRGCDSDVLGTDHAFLAVYAEYEEEFVRQFLVP